MKYLIHMRNELVQNFTREIVANEMYISHVKWNIHTWKLISHMKLKQFTYEILFSYAKLSVKFLQGYKKHSSVYSTTL